MNRYFVSEIYPAALHQAGKHRQDVEQTLLAMGFTKIVLAENKGVWGRLKPYLQLLFWCAKIKKESLVHFHFPIPSKAKRVFQLLLRAKKVHTIAFTFDVEGLRSSNPNLLQKEVKQLRRFSFVQTQNKKMQAALQQQGLGKNIHCLPFIDHMGAYEKNAERPIHAGLAFAGNLDKAAFLRKAHTLPEVNFFVYGHASQPLPSAANLFYEGVVHPEELPLCMKGSFGLVWDGPDVESCNPPFGDYLRYNTPFKAATYVMAGLPLVVWSESAIAHWVLAHKTGIVVPSLHAATACMARVTPQEYSDMRRHLVPWQTKMASGGFYKTAIEEVMTLLYDKHGKK